MNEGYDFDSKNCKKRVKTVELQTRFLCYYGTEWLRCVAKRVYGKSQLIEERVHPIAIMFVVF